MTIVHSNQMEVSSVDTAAPRVTCIDKTQAVRGLLNALTNARPLTGAQRRFVARIVSAVSGADGAEHQREDMSAHGMAGLADHVLGVYREQLAELVAGEAR